jgi:hypothetical protein
MGSRELLRWLRFQKIEREVNHLPRLVPSGQCTFGDEL